MNNFFAKIKEGNLEEIKKLNLTLEIIIRSKNNYALILASSYGHLEVVKYLIKKLNFTLEDIRNVDNFAFGYASYYGHLEVVKYLIDKGLTLEDIKSRDNYALRLASENGHLEVVKFLVNKGLTLEDIRSQDNFAFRYASSNGHLEVVKYLEEQIKILEAKEEHKKEWDYVCGEIEYKPELGIKYFEHLEEFIK